MTTSRNPIATTAACLLAALALAGCGGTPPDPLRLADAEGPWTHVDNDAQTFRFVNVALRDDGGTLVQPYGSCDPWECVAVPFVVDDGTWTRNAEGGLASPPRVVDTGFSEVTYVVRFESVERIVLSHTSDYDDDRPTRTFVDAYRPADSFPWDRSLTGTFEGEAGVLASDDLGTMTATLSDADGTVQGTFEASGSLLADCWGDVVDFVGTRDDHLVDGTFTGSLGTSTARLHLIDGVRVQANLGDDYQGTCDLAGGFSIGRLEPR